MPFLGGGRRRDGSKRAVYGENRPSSSSVIDNSCDDDDQLWFRPKQLKKASSASKLDAATMSSMDRTMALYKYWASRAGPKLLSGANIHVLVDEAQGNEVEVSNAITRVNMAIEGMGGKIARTLDENATHVLWAMPNTLRREKLSRQKTADLFLQETVSLCQELKVPIVDVKWLDRVSSLKENEHWSHVNPRRYEPPFVSTIRRICDVSDMKKKKHRAAGSSDSPKPGTVTRVSLDSDAGTTHVSGSTAVQSRTARPDHGKGASSHDSRVATMRTRSPKPVAGNVLGKEHASSRRQGTRVSSVHADSNGGGSDGMDTILHASTRTTGKGTATTNSRRGDSHVKTHTNPIVRTHATQNPVRATVVSSIPTSVDPMAERTTTTAVSQVDVDNSDNSWEHGRDPPLSMSRSISETFASLTHSDQTLLEEDAIRRAMELSMLDCALVYQRPSPTEQGRRRRELAPHEVLGVSETASPAEVRAAYRRRARMTHPDKGGSDAAFERVARAYRSFLNKGHDDHNDKDEPVASIKDTAHWDCELREHNDIVRDLFLIHGADVTSNVARQKRALTILGLKRKDAGASNHNERNELIRNSCFYLSLAASYLDGIGAISSWHGRYGCDAGGINDGEESEDEPDCYPLEDTDTDTDEALIRETALQLKRVIEAGVVSAHPEWIAKGMVGEEVQAFSDFLVYLLDTHTLVADWAVAIFDTTSGFVDVYKGGNYDDNSDGDDGDVSRSNTLTLWYEPGHYQCLLPIRASARPSLSRILVELDRTGVFYVVTDGSV